MGVIMVILAAMLWSTMGVAIRNLDQMNTWQVLFWRSLGMIPVLAAFVWWRAGPTPFRALGTIGLAGLLGALGLVAAFGGAIFAIQRLPLANAVFLFSAAPFLTALLGMIVLKERVRPATWASIGLAGLGIWRMIGGTSLTDGAMIGNLAALGSAMGFSIFTVALRSGKSEDMLPTVILGGGFSMLAATLILFAQGLLLVGSGHDTVLALGMGAVILGFGMTLFTLGSRVVPAGELALLSLIEVMLAPVWGWLLLSEVPAPAVLQGGGLVLMAVILNAATGLRARSAALA
jgi:drug/metabolite transporter (DMT)-like permease